MGGSSDVEWGSSIFIDLTGNIYVIGSTRSSDFPITTGAYDTYINGVDYSYDAFITRLDKDLTSLLASTYLGGSGYYDNGNSIAIDSNGYVYVAGNTESSDFPTTIDASDTSYGGYGDAFVSKLNSNLTSLLASTFLGGSSHYDDGSSITVNSNGNIYVTGKTSSSNFPTTTGSYDTYYNGSDTDVFVSKLSGDLINLLSSTYLGGSSNDYGNSIITDSSGNIYVTGKTSSSNFPTTTGAYDTSYNGVYGDAFVSKLNSDLTSLLASTFLGGNTNDEGISIIINQEDIYVAGNTLSIDFPTTPSAYDNSYGGDGDIFMSKLNGSLSSLLASTFLGGISNDYVKSIDKDLFGNIYAAGNTDSSDFPITTGAYYTEYNGGFDGFVSKLNGTLTNLLSSTFLDLGTYPEGNVGYMAIDSVGNIYVAGIETVGITIEQTHKHKDSL